ncbi:MAG: PIG-L deacetylase family protein [Clostridia bacterium]
MKKLKVMAIYAHPADPITDCGGALALHAENGDEVSTLVLTHGGRKHPNYFVKEWRKENPDQKVINMNKQDIIDFKKAELMRAAEIIGINRVYCLDYDDDCLMLSDNIIDAASEVIAKERPDIIIMDYPYDWDVHSVATRIAHKALERIGYMLQNMDSGKMESESFQYSPKAIFYTKIPVTVSDALTIKGFRNDVFIDITGVVEKKIRAMDQFISQSYHGDFARKFVEAHDGAYGRAAGVAYAEGFHRLENETFTLLPVSDFAMGVDRIMNHEDYSHMDIRKTFPYDPQYYEKNFPRK